jgi:RNA polymerase sigma-70 factor (ECF subfamily)
MWLMNPEATQLSLLSRVRDPENAAAWREFEERYRELLVRFCRRRGLQHADAEDIVQVLMASLARTLPSFVYDPARGRFRDYLFRCARNAISQWAARPKHAGGSLGKGGDSCADLVGAADAAPDEAVAWEQEWVAHHYRLAMQAVRTSFDPRSIELFERSVGGVSVAALAEEYQLSHQAVHKVRQRIRKRMEELISQQIRDEDRIDG